MILSVVEHYPAYPLDKALETESLVISLLFMRIPGIQHRLAWPFIQLMAFVGNALGGKGKGGEAPDAGSVWTAAELAPGFQPQPLSGMTPAFEPQHCYALDRAIEAGLLPSWCIQAIEREDNLQRVRQVGEGYAALLGEASVTDDG